ncbi:UNVERIFIED_CONTAM: hypothetical protein K2H54_075372 [Gekko kuhli]
MEAPSMRNDLAQATSDYETNNSDSSDIVPNDDEADCCKEQARTGPVCRPYPPDTILLHPLLPPESEFTSEPMGIAMQPAIFGWCRCTDTEIQSNAAHSIKHDK